MTNQQKSDFNMRVAFYGRKLFFAQLYKSPSAIWFVRTLNTTSVLDAVQSGVRVYKPLWMSVLTAMTGKLLPNGNRDFGYIPFIALWPRKADHTEKRYYRFCGIKNPEQSEESVQWALHSF